jgi:hypothetical protein
MAGIVPARRGQRIEPERICAKVNTVRLPPHSSCKSANNCAGHWQAKLITTNRLPLEDRVPLARFLLLIASLLISCLTLAQTVEAQVYEVGQGGAMHIREGGGAVVWRHAGRRDQAAISAPIAAIITPATLFPHTDNAALLARTAARYSLSPALLEALVWQESRWRTEAVSPKGALGLTQLMPATALALGVDPRDPEANLEGGARYLRMQLDRFGGDVVKALAAYNAGPERVERAGGVPAIRETQTYVAAIMARLSRLDSYIR